MKKVLLVGYIGGLNVGDEAIGAAVAQQIQNDSTEIYIATGQPDVSEQYLGKSYHYLKCTYPGRPITTKDFFILVATIRKMDRVIFVGGGILQDVHSAKLMEHCTLIAAIAKYYKIPSLATGVGFGPISSDYGHTLGHRFLDSVQRINYRDIESLNASNNAYGEYSYKCELGSDSIYLINSQLTKHEAKKTSRVGLAFRQWKGLHIDFLAEIIEKLLNDGVTPVFFAYESDDLILYRQLLELFPEKIELSDERCFSKTLESIKGLEGLISMRLHANLFAIMSNIPFVALSYDPKINNVIGRLGYQDAILTLDNSAEDVLVKLKGFSPSTVASDKLNNAFKLNELNISEFMSADHSQFEFKGRGKTLGHCINLFYDAFIIVRLQKFALFIGRYTSKLFPSKFKEYIRSKLKFNW
ncbi:polysaccharide pyruvyl transferase family protein [Colwellia sp. D2M02]|uniref:polysaccharide pyruvyl transferase family protein n=1 Tax=Colwellia sp. D2M02 TaxID=2841562 RepID=UPI001C093D65|nr:polysaccharide pyruvyl transferase family protein [Colwellia sp. D2M02]MBU2894680.1 polysaccharide pyruvyl transferase family protein [Colwellia sp. D2M02]